ncbi:hypothetical protein F4827_003243 [Paraburkholderia bannensis]|uniref:Transposase DDE domain-containing protein n=1 Tax=Paraburkholderia bannensis TaxID=765414 RepID=A0A7W9TXV2_9BURK|nr:hypothetical protein [Paraburkholderia sp. WP4_3_2]MBB6103388.1 hypothetical protein [Paraburkholderia bannensis]
MAVDTLGQLLAVHITPAILLPRRRVVERSFGWLNRFRRLARDYERLPETLAGLHFVVFAVLMPVHFAALNTSALHALTGLQVVMQVCVSAQLRVLKKFGAIVRSRYIVTVITILQGCPIYGTALKMGIASDNNEIFDFIGGLTFVYVIIYIFILIALSKPAFRPEL